LNTQSSCIIIINTHERATRSISESETRTIRQTPTTIHVRKRPRESSSHAMWPNMHCTRGATKSGHRCMSSQHACALPTLRMRATATSSTHTRCERRQLA
jgi:hypothetical protein